MYDFSGQTIIVTGCTRGIGAAISRYFLAAGARVLGIYLSNEAAAQAFRQSCAEHEQRLALYRCDVADSAAVQHFFSNLDEPIQVLVNSSGMRQDALLGMMSDSAWEQVISVNLTGVFYMCKQAVRAMMSQRYGRIINLSSLSARLSLAGQTNYAAAKAGVQALTRALALEVATRGITVNCVAPGLIHTDFIRDLPEEKLASLTKSIAMQRLGSPEEVAAAVLFLASKEASYITGTTLEVTGGI
jgi:3-oxoacyl-[acyl-carrier protein] reductase